MKLLIIQLSDLHCADSADTSSNKIHKAVEAIVSSGHYDKAIIVFSGDLTATAKASEFSATSKVISAFICELRKVAFKEYIEAYYVPGNHDLQLDKNDRDIKVIEKWVLQDHVDEEILRLSNFYYFAQKRNCFCANKLIDVKTVSFADKTIQFVLLNSALFSTRAKEDKQTHFLPENIIRRINSDTSPDLRIAVMHHSYEWCEWNTKEALKKEFSKFDLVMFGHDHVPERISIVSRNGGMLDVLKGGELTLSLSTDSSFNTVSYDTEANTITCYEYIWDKDDRLFIVKPTDTKEINRDELSPRLEYLDALLKDSQQISEKLSDYFVFPKLFQKDGSFSDDTHIFTDESSFFSFLDHNRLVGITGSNSCGKSSLLKMLYKDSIEHGFLPLFIEKRNYDSRIEKMLRDLFEEQYGNIPHGYEKYIQATEKKRIYFVDDFDQITSEKARSNLVSYILDHNGILVYSTNDWLKNDLIDTVKERIQERASCVLEVLPFYKEKRDELANRIFQLYDRPLIASIDLIIAALDYLAQCQSGLFSLTPEYLVQYLKFFLSTDSFAGKGRETLTIIFETNIRNSIIKNAKSEDVAIYLSALEYIAYEMYFIKRIERITLDELQGIINSFNTNRRCNIQIKPFIETCTQAGIISESDSDYSFFFSSKNTYAYFVAKRINATLEKDSKNLADVKFVLSHICFGINDTIVLFLSTLRSNSSLILIIAKKAQELLSDYPELDFDANNLPFLKNWHPSQQRLPTPKELKKATENTEAVEKQRQEYVKYRGIFDYSEEDVEADKYRVQRAFRYLQIISRALVDQYGSLEASEITCIVSAIYHLTPKVIYAYLSPFQDNYEDTINALRVFTEQLQIEEKFSDEDLKKLLSHAAILFTLDVMNDVAYNASTRNTIQVLDELELINSNHLLQNLMMYENAGDSSAFVSKAIDVISQVNGDYFVSSLVSRIARKHVIFTPNISHSLVDKLISGHVFSSKSKKTMLIEQRSRESKKK